LRKTSAGTAALALVAALLAGCQGSNTRDLEGVKIKDPARAEIYANLDQHPNIVRLCIDGLAFVTTSRKEDVLMRVPEWDGWCKG
jgi:hypothetical protein